MNELSREQLEYLLNQVNVPYRKRCIWQGLVHNREIKLYALETEAFAYVEKVEQGEVVGYFFDVVDERTKYDLQNWNVVYDVTLDLIND